MNHRVLKTQTLMNLPLITGVLIMVTLNTGEMYEKGLKYQEFKEYTRTMDSYIKDQMPGHRMQ